MTDRQSPFASSLFPFVASNLAPHKNPVTCILAGLDRPLAVCTQAERIEGDIVVIRPGVEHWVEVHGSAKVLYFDGLEFPLVAALAARVPREVAALAIDALASMSGAQEELRARFSRGRERCPAAIARTINAIAHDPMARMNQGELSERLRLGRTQAMRAFKAATGMTFREFKRWTALCAATRQIAEGELVRTAAMDAGFDRRPPIDAHLARALARTRSSSWLDVVEKDLARAHTSMADLEAALVDLEGFAKLPPLTPTADVLACFDAMLAVIATLPARSRSAVRSSPVNFTVLSCAPTPPTMFSALHGMQRRRPLLPLGRQLLALNALMKRLQPDVLLEPERRPGLLRRRARVRLDEGHEPADVLGDLGRRCSRALPRRPAGLRTLHGFHWFRGTARRGDLLRAACCGST